MSGLPSLVGALTTARAAIVRAIADLRTYADRADTPAPLRDQALALVATMELLLSDTDFTRITETIFAELKDAALKGKSVVTHNPTDVF